jgi:hypothetical protein
VSYHPPADDSRSRRSGTLKIERGSHKRVNRIKWQQHTPLDFRIFVLILLLALIALAAWLLNHPPEAHHFHPHGPS